MRGSHGCANSAKEHNMAGVYGEINSRDDFFRVLNEALQYCSHILKINPSDAIFRRIQMELEAIKKWTINTRTPTKDERATIDIGLVAARELDPIGDPDTKSMSDKLKVLDAYFER